MMGAEYLIIKLFEFDITSVYNRKIIIDKNTMS